MSILRVARMGHPVLRRVAAPVPPEEIANDRVQRLVDDLLDTVDAYDGAGLAAPQVHESVRIVVLSLPAGDGEDPDESAEEMQVWINPVLTPLTDEHLGSYEGCLSVPGLRGLVYRPAAVDVRALDRHGAEIRRRLQGFPAVVAQHECDHLDGVLYVDRIEPGTMAFTEELQRFGPPHTHLPGEDDGDDETEGGA